MHSHTANFGSSRCILSTSPAHALGAVRWTLLLIVSGFLGSTAEAITITYNYHEQATPSFDPDGSELRRITDHAIHLWSSYIEDDKHYHFDLSWKNMKALGAYEPRWIASPNIVLDSTPTVSGQAVQWFFDPTPLVNEEYGKMQQTLVRDLDPDKKADGFVGTPPDLLEAGFLGTADSSSFAHDKVDLLTVLLHEIGHMLGVHKWLLDFGNEEYDFNPATVGGISIGAAKDDGHIKLDTALMRHAPGDPRSQRRLPSATDILATFEHSIRTEQDRQTNEPVVVFSFQNYNLPRVNFIGAQSEDWNDTLNWIGGKVPDFDNEVTLRQSASVVQSSNLSLARSLLVTENATLRVQGKELVVKETTTLGSSDGHRGTIHIGNPDGPSATLETDHLVLTGGLVNITEPQGRLRVNHTARIDQDGVLAGRGVAMIGDSLINDGQIHGGRHLQPSFGGTLTLMKLGNTVLDLDGSGVDGSGQEQGRIEAASGNLEVFGELSDQFHGTATIGSDRHMRFSHPWEMYGTLNLDGGTADVHAASLTGAHVTIGREVNVRRMGRIVAPMTIESDAIVNLPTTEDRLMLAGPTRLEGGEIRGQGTLVIDGHTIAARSIDIGNGPPAEDGPPSWEPPDFELPVQDPPILEPPILQPPVLDTSALQLGVSPATQQASVAGGPVLVFPYRLDVPVQVRSGGVLDADESSLHLARKVTLSGGTITGDQAVKQVGDLVVDGGGLIDAATYLWGADAPGHRTTVKNGSYLALTPHQIAPAGSSQQYVGSLAVEPDSTIHVDIESTDTWTLAGGMELGVNSKVTGDNIVNEGWISGAGRIEVDRLLNNGFIMPGDSWGGLNLPGTEFLQSDSGTLRINIGKDGLETNAGVLHAQTASLDGLLEVKFLDGFSPEIGSEWEILTASSITGQFSNVTLLKHPNTPVFGQLLYEPTRVALRVLGSPLAGNQSAAKPTLTGFHANSLFATQAVPEPGTLLLGVVGLIAALARRAPKLSPCR